MQRQHQLFFPFGGPVGNGFAQGPPLEPAAGARQFLEFRRADRHDEKATLVMAAKETFGGKAIEGFTNRRGTGAILGNDPLDAQLAFGFKSAAEKIITQLMIDRAGKCALGSGPVVAQIGSSVRQKRLLVPLLSSWAIRVRNSLSVRVPYSAT